MKIPFEATISGAYRFAFTNILSIVGIAWFPSVVLCALVGGMIYLSLPELAAFINAISQSKGGGAPPPPTLLPAMFGLFGRYFVLFILLIVYEAMVSVGVMRKALGQHPGPVFFFFSLGGQVWRLIGSYMLLLLIGYGMGLLLIFVVAIIGYVLHQTLPDQQALNILITVLCGIAAGCGMLYAAVRALFFIPAVVVAENHIGIRRSWQLGRGNFWRIVGTYLIVTVPLAVAVQIVIFTAVQIVAGPNAMMTPMDNDPAEAARFLKHFGELLITLAPVLVIVQLVSLILRSGLVNGAIGTAYTLVTGSEQA
ncbi:MAG: hypothetical protein JSR60_17055 [Proteobacteria bacterium]|nr:hypothetical protein [Pseudomonadota bacterium]